MPDALVYYALSLSGLPHESRLLQQLLKSIASLRAQNRSLPVRLQLCGELPPPVALYLHQALGVEIVPLGAYSERLEAYVPGAAARLADFPFLSKYLGFERLPPLQQVLYVDCDTYFFADPARLFAACREAELYAREEPGGPDSPSANPAVIDVAALQALASAEGARYVKPFNTGVMLFNHGLWERLPPLLPRFLADLLRMTPEGEQPAALACPAADAYIRDQVAFWLLMGRIEHFRLARLGQDQLTQGLAELQRRGRAAPPLLAHYFGSNTKGFFAWLDP